MTTVIPKREVRLLLLLFCCPERVGCFALQKDLVE